MTTHVGKYLILQLHGGAASIWDSTLYRSQEEAQDAILKGSKPEKTYLIVRVTDKVTVLTYLKGDQL